MVDIDDEIEAAVKKLKRESEMIYEDFKDRIPTNKNEFDEQAKFEIKQALDDAESTFNKTIKEIRKAVER